MLHMDCTFTQLPYGETGYFSDVVRAYTEDDVRLRPFYKYPASLEGINQAVEERKRFPMDRRRLLVSELERQYSLLPASEKVNRNIRLLLEENTFTVCTAHQPAIFTGNLFFIYKILHAVRLAEYCSKTIPGNNFIPVFYMGSEDADLDELGHLFLKGEKIVWNTSQKGAIGRMNTDGLDKIINRIEGELSVLPYGKALITLLKECYLQSDDIQTATLKLLHRLFEAFGLVVVIPDNPAFKKVLLPVFEDDLFHQTAVELVNETAAEIGTHFKVQAHPRSINLFYLKEDIRERIEKNGDHWNVVNTDIVFNSASLKKELEEHPERFSPNVILRGLLQESILPGVAFIGGGGEIAYWMELKKVFEQYKVPYPVLVVRNSFLVIEEKWKQKLDKLQISMEEIFKDDQTLMNHLVRRESDQQLTLADEINQVSGYYDLLKSMAEKVDETLTGHVAALQTRAIRPLKELEKKMLRAEKRKFTQMEGQLKAIRQELFPNNGLQERVENFMPFYARWGQEFIQKIYDHSLTLEQRFGVLVVS